MCLTINRCKYRPIFKYAHLFIYLYILKTMSSSQCLHFQSNPTGSAQFPSFLYLQGPPPIVRILSHGSLPPHSWIPHSPHYFHGSGQTLGRYVSPPTGSEALHWTSAPTPTGQLPCSALLNVFPIESGLVRGRRLAFPPGKKGPQLSRGLLSNTSALFFTKCIISSACGTWLYCHKWLLTSNDK